MNVSQLEQPKRSNIWRRVKRRKWWEWLLFVIPLALGLSYCGAFSPILSPLVYPNLAPPGWHNITPHGNIRLNSFAANADTPGLMMTCGTAWSITVTDPSTWRLGQLHFWRSRDGGAHWELLHGPFGEGDLCDVSMPAGAPGVITATVETYSSSDANFSVTSATTWMSHDAGTSWRKIATVSGSSYIDYGPGPYYRHGLTYEYGTWDDQTSVSLAYSADDGITWIPIPSAPTKLEQQGWQIDTDSSYPVPDYRGDLWWYRVLSKQGQPPMLEHSTDDGHTWMLVGAIGTEPMQSVLLATTPLQPTDVCAAHLSGETNHLSILASADDGKNWRTGAMPSSLVNTTGETAFALNIGAEGDCYQGYLYHRAQISSDENDYAFLRLAPTSSTLQVIPLGNDQNTLDYRTMYVPAGNGMSARLVANPALPFPGMAAAVSDLATETDRGQLLWTAVP